MTDLAPLIRVRKYEVEERQKHLADLYAKEAALEAQKEAIKQRLIHEEEASAQNENIDMLRYFHAYKQSVLDQIEGLTQQQKALQSQIEQARESVRLAFAELKKVELTKEARDKEDKAQRDKKENDQFDDIALQIYQKEDNAT